MKNISTIFYAAAVIVAAGSGHAAIWSATPNAAIPDNSPNLGAASDIYIGAGDSQLSGIANPAVGSVASVQFTITGGWDGDYTLSLKHMDAGGLTSQSVTLFNLIGGGANAGSGFNNVTLAVGNPDINSAPSSSDTAITGTWAPQGGLDFGGFQNTSPTGDWILYATDNHAGDQGTLTSWNLNLTVVPEPANVALGIFGGWMGALALMRFKPGKSCATNRSSS